MRAAVYARVSTLGKGQDPGVQLREFSDYAERRGWTVAGEYVDVGISGTKDRRPELDRLMADAHRRKFDVVVVWKFDRFARCIAPAARSRNVSVSRHRVRQSDRRRGPAPRPARWSSRSWAPWPSWSAH
jgi:DNA invertase Pin-like site-specific DNA recombinase